jgi:hypothetical protein
MNRVNISSTKEFEMSELAKTQETENTETVVVAEAPAPKKEWKCHYGRTIGRNPREKQGWQTNADYAAQQEHFKKACELAGTPATARQASKFRAKKGLAYEAHKRSLNG